MPNAATMSELADACKVWSGDDAGFAVIVGSYLQLSGTDQRVLADEFEAAVSTVSRWANGITKPRPRMQKLIVAWISKRAARAAEATRVAETARNVGPSASSPKFPIAAKGK